MNRRLKRALIRENAKSQRQSRKLNWDKVKSFIRFMFLLWIGISLFIFVILLFQVVDRNSVRDAVLKNPVETRAVIVRKKSSLRRSTGYLGEFKFSVSGESYVGTTFKSYEGQIGQTICVQYLASNPEQNISCKDLAYESIKEDVIFSSLKACLLIIGVTTVMYIFWIFFNYKEFLKEFT
ncbi:hypothetical protein [Arcicella rosea]|uniref:DUF3592 domain-containing protein n=1 Tax=Arcicella rosea TaxID=502909 RepID=A0A841EJ30_9BACT|nr:hypothetical protein [Arcicella rosea]MBB6001399.1 hypothetical protein [Arcicella rosea]